MSDSLRPLPPLPATRPAPVATPAPTTGIIPATTLAIWLTCLAVGGLGKTLHYPAVRLPPVDAPVAAQFIHVDLTQSDARADLSDATSGDTPPPPETSEPPPPVPAPPVPSEAPPLMAVAEPNPAIAFALPVVGPSKLVDPKRAVPTKAPSGPTPNLAGNTVRHLTFGRGEGAQPSPEYPPEAARAGEVGVVSVRFAVAENGNVVSAEIVTPCRSPILNQAALRTIRDRWHFPPGEKRLYEISINFQLDKQ